MRRRIPPSPWPEVLATCRPDEWQSKPLPWAAWCRARFEYARDHPELGADPVDLLKAARDARRLCMYEVVR